MPIIPQPLIPHGKEYTMGVNGLSALPAGARWGIDARPASYKNPNKSGCHFATPIPAGVSQSASRNTLAMDVKFDSQYLSTGGHGGIVSRHLGAPYSNPGDNRGGAIIFGEWGVGANRLAIEEIEISNQQGNLFAGIAPNPILQPNRWYRCVIDTVYYNGGVMNAARCIDIATGQGVYATQDCWSPAPWNYPVATPSTPPTATIFSVLSNGGSFKVGRTMSYWSHATEWVANP